MKRKIEIDKPFFVLCLIAIAIGVIIGLSTPHYAKIRADWTIDEYHESMERRILLTNTNLFRNKDVECSRLGFGYNYNYSSDVCQKLSLDVADYSGCFSRKFEINKYVLPKNITCPNKDFIEVRNNENVLEQIEKAERYNRSSKIIYFNKECGIQIVRENWMGGYIIYNQDGFLRGYDNIENRNMTVCY